MGAELCLEIADIYSSHASIIADMTMLVIFISRDRAGTLNIITAGQFVHLQVNNIIVILCVEFDTIQFQSIFRKTTRGKLVHPWRVPKRGRWQLRHNLSTYDAAYVVLAEKLGAALVTRDRRLASASGHAAAIELF